MNVLVNGIGNIGSTLINLLLKYSGELGIDEIHACKRTIAAWNKAELDILTAKGIKICTSGDSKDYPQLGNILPQINYIFEATTNGVGVTQKERYDRLPNLIGSCAQGSEKDYGVSFMSGVNNEIIRSQKFVHVVSCNTHGSAALIRLFAGDQLENLEKADMVVVRRSEDIGNHERLVSANVVARHLDAEAGTHHSIDVRDMFKTIDLECNLTSSDITTPSQLMHSVRFNIDLKNPLEKDVDELIANQPLISKTNKFDSNVVFELGRRYGVNGRLYSHAIVISGNLLVSEKSIKGWAFIPQEGNSILSTLHAFLLQTNHPNETDVFNSLVADLCQNEW
ncbi:MAG: glyceraldehyde-3-phosphate dehydrogenase type II [Arenicella sp.]|jgi:glyceraldehyde-3-phosphate dehydrogenase type II